MADSPSILLIVGLGNPGAKYDQTRHNAGFWFLDELASHVISQGVGWKLETKLHGLILKTEFAGRQIWLLKPNTFMNLSGQAVQAVSHYYKIPRENILVAHDELDLPSGIAKLKRGGGHGGHNGLRDIINRLGGKDFVRLRVGIDHPGTKDQVVDYVLTKPSQADRKQIENALYNATNVIELLVNGEHEKAMHQLHTK